MELSHTDEPSQRVDAPADGVWTANAELRSGVLASPADEMLSRAIHDTLQAPAGDRARLFEQHARDIESAMAAHPVGRPWSCRVYTGTDGSRIFRGGVGHSLVVDTEGRLWRGRSYEDFATTYLLMEGRCEIDTLTPLFHQMRQCLPRSAMSLR